MYKNTYNCIMMSCNIPKYGIKPPNYETLEIIFCMSKILIVTKLYCINVHLPNLKYGK